MGNSEAPTLVFDDGPFPVATLSRSGTLQSANAAWAKVAAGGSTAWEALGLIDSDRDDFLDMVQLVAEDRTPAWVDVDVPVFAEKRWARCHLWPSEQPGVVLAAVVPLRETRDIELSRVEADHIERILEHTADAITIVGEDMNFRFASGISTRWLGMSGSALEGHNSLSFVFPDDHHLLMAAFSECLENPRKSVKARFRVVHESGDLIWVEGIGTNMFDDPAIRGILVSLNDITELVETRATAEANEQALALEKQRYEMLAQFTPTGVFELDARDALTFHNERFNQLLGIPESGHFDWASFDERDRDALRAAFARTRSGIPTQSTVRLARRPRDGGQRWLTIRAVAQEAGRLLGSLEDTTTQITKEAELAHRADHDDLTGLPNRENLLDQLEQLTSIGEPIAILFLDLDNFKDINDGLGHQVGDQVLIEIAGRIRSVVRPADIVGRLHGDEFLVVCRYTDDISTAHDIAARVVESVGQPLTTAGQQLMVSGSVGIALSGDAPTTPEQLLVDADVAMYEAKRRGGSRSVPFNTALGERAADRLRLHGEVQRAAANGELEVHYQPIVDLVTGAIVRSEALVRWRHPTQGYVLPERFIPELEKSELIDELGRWIIERAITDLAATVPQSLPINVNVSPRQLEDPAFADNVLGLLDKHQVPGSQLTLEITELIMLDTFDPVEKQLHELRDRGVGISIDDFGTGYSALTYLQRFPFDQIKIDGAFIGAIDTSPTDRAIVRAIIELVTSLGALTIAEKVERQEQVDALIELGCPLGQGFFLGEPTATPAATRPA